MNKKRRGCGRQGNKSIKRQLKEDSRKERERRRNK